MTDAAAKKADAKVTVELWMVGDAEAVTVTIDGQQKETPVENGYAKAVFDLANVHLWDGVDDPYLYTAKAELSDGDIVETTFWAAEVFCQLIRKNGFFLMDGLIRFAV